MYGYKYIPNNLLHNYYHKRILKHRTVEMRGRTAASIAHTLAAARVVFVRIMSIVEIEMASTFMCVHASLEEKGACIKLSLRCQLFPLRRGN